MIIHGLNRLTLLDYPEHTACTMFTGACNFRCPFCQNGALVLHPEEEPVIPEEEIFGFLEKRRGILDGVCVTGGEPTLQNGLEEFLRRIKEMGFLVKLDTNGTNPDLLEKLTDEHLLDMAAMDIKTSRAHYANAAGLGGGALPAEQLLRKVERSAGFLLENRIPYEFRTTMVRGLVTEEDMSSIGEWLAGAERYYLQNYEDSEGVLDRSMQGYTPDEMRHMLEILRRWVPNAKLRGVS